LAPFFLSFFSLFSFDAAFLPFATFSFEARLAMAMHLKKNRKDSKKDKPKKSKEADAPEAKQFAGSP